MTDLIETDIAIIGAGPAGLAALDELDGHGLRIVMIDEQTRAGGQIYRQPPATFTVRDWLKGKLYGAGKDLLRRAEAAGDAEWLIRTTALGFFEDGDGGRILWLSTPQGLRRLRARAYLIAPGCYDMPVAFPGWTLPGVMAAGGIQAFAKSQQIVPGERFVFVGSHPLQLIVADQIEKGGGRIAAVVFSQSPMSALRVLAHPAVLLRHWRKFAETARILLRLRRAGVPVLFDRTIRAAEGAVKVEAAAIAHADGRDAGRIPCDRIGVCYGFLPSSELARQAGTEARWDDGWVVPHDGRMRTTVPGLYVAGEITGVAGAEVSAEEGRLAGLSILHDLGVRDAADRSRQVRRRLRSLNAFAALLRRLSQPPAGLAARLAGDDTILCRCEKVTFGAFRAAMGEASHIASADAAKLLARTGMGLCQGRYCGHAVRRELGTDEGFTVRPPVKPVPIRDLVG